MARGTNDAMTMEEMVVVVVIAERDAVADWHEALTLAPEMFDGATIIGASVSGQERVAVQVAITRRHHDYICAANGADLIAPTLVAELDAKAWDVLDAAMPGPDDTREPAPSCEKTLDVLSPSPMAEDDGDIPF